ncbi:MAG: alpha/beta fold hydrolase [Burkholderiales bacterium]|nr:alpha/beta fold hydrolase [Burkholderiales bacterium]
MSDLTASRVARLVARYPLARAATALGEVSYRSAGAGAALVLLHGIGSQSGSWAQQLAALADRHRVVAWDAPGYGESAPLAPAAPTAADYAARLGDFLDALGIARAVLVASSLGALMAGAFAARWPERVAGLVLLNPAGGYGLAEPAVREAKLAARLERLATLGPAGMARNLPAGMLAPKASDTARALAAWGQSSIQPHGYAQAARMLANGRLAEDAARYAGPVLVVAADADTITPLAECQRIARAFPRARFRMVEGAGHLSYLDSPEVVNDAVTEFAARCAEEARA